MPEGTLEERLAAVERALVDADLDDVHANHDADRAADSSTDSDRLGPTGDPADGLGTRVADLEEDVAELEAAVQAVRGYVGEVKHVNDEVEHRADAALAKAETVERLLVPGRSNRDDHPDPEPGVDPDHETGPATSGHRDGATGVGAGTDSSLGESRSGDPPGRTNEHQTGMGGTDWTGPGQQARDRSDPEQQGVDSEERGPAKMDGDERVPPGTRSLEARPDDDGDGPGLLARLREVL